jgi:hypothetical protein
MKSYERLFLHRKAIADEYKRGARIKELRRKFSCSNSDLRDILQLVLGEDEYRKLARQRRNKVKKISSSPKEKKQTRPLKRVRGKKLSIHHKDFVDHCVELIKDRKP